MLTKFSVENFKNFYKKTTFDLSNPCYFEFNNNAIADNCLTTGLVYGPNGSGKSNLGLALFDIILHLTEKKKKIEMYSNYINLDSDNAFATFEYYFLFNGKEVFYKYSKTDYQTLLLEQLYIDGKEVIHYDFTAHEGFTDLAGAETLNIVATNSSISRVKFVRNNAILSDNEVNKVFVSFFDFVDRMLMFYSLDRRGYQGFTDVVEDIGSAIIESGRLKKFETFLQSHGLNYELFEKQIDDKLCIYSKFKQKEANFWNIASTGTKSLALFYYWFMRIREASLVFIDEFDAFYHHELAAGIVSMLRDAEKTQVILTTHNTDLLSNDLLRPDCYFIIKENSAIIAPLSSLTEKELRKAHNLQKMYKAGAFNE